MMKSEWFSDGGYPETLPDEDFELLCSIVKWGNQRRLGNLPPAETVRDLIDRTLFRWGKDGNLRDSHGRWKSKYDLLRRMHGASWILIELRKRRDLSIQHAFLKKDPEYYRRWGEAHRENQREANRKSYRKRKSKKEIDRDYYLKKRMKEYEGKG